MYKIVNGFGGRYEVSDIGEVRSLINTKGNFTEPHILKQYKNPFGYPAVYLYEKDKSHRRRKHYLVHRLMAETFIPNPHKLRDVNHIDGIKDHNFLENLEWLSRSDNEKHAFKLGLKIAKKGTQNYLAKLNDNDVKFIRANENIISRKELSIRFGISESTLRNAQIGKTWKHV